MWSGHQQPLNPTLTFLPQLPWLSLVSPVLLAFVFHLLSTSCLIPYAMSSGMEGLPLSQLSCTACPECDQHPRHGEVLVPGTQECDLIWKQGLCRWNQGKMKSLWSLIKCECAHAGSPTVKEVAMGVLPHMSKN